MNAKADKHTRRTVVTITMAVIEPGFNECSESGSVLVLLDCSSGPVVLSVSVTEDVSEEMKTLVTDGEEISDWVEDSVVLVDDEGVAVLVSVGEVTSSVVVVSFEAAVEISAFPVVF